MTYRSARRDQRHRLARRRMRARRRARRLNGPTLSRFPHRGPEQ